MASGKEHKEMRKSIHLRRMLGVLAMLAMLTPAAWSQ